MYLYYSIQYSTWHARLAKFKIRQYVLVSDSPKLMFTKFSRYTIFAIHTIIIIRLQKHSVYSLLRVIWNHVYKLLIFSFYTQDKSKLISPNRV